MSKAKKKKKKQKQESILTGIDQQISNAYNEIIQDINAYQMLIQEADKKAAKKERKRLKHDKNYIYTGQLRKESRLKIINEMEGKGFLDRVEESIQMMVGVVKIIARLIAALITAILSFEPIKVLIKPNMLNKLNTVYALAMSIH